MTSEQVRKRPGMYIGDTTDGSGLHNMIFEVVGNAMNEAISGHCDRIEIDLNADGSVMVSDDGRGIPVDDHYGKPAAEIIATELYAGGKFDGNTYKVTSLHGVGLSVVNALSEKFSLHIWRSGTEYFLQFHRGFREASLKTLGPAPLVGKRHRNGTAITFKPDATVFTDTCFDIQTIDRHLRKFASFDCGATILLSDRRNGEPVETRYQV